MKKFVIAIILAQALFFNMLNADYSPYNDLSLFAGDINNPDIKVLVEEPEFLVIELDGIKYVYPLE